MAERSVLFIETGFRDLCLLQEICWQIDPKLRVQVSYNHLPGIVDVLEQINKREAIRPIPKVIWGKRNEEYFRYQCIIRGADEYVCRPEQPNALKSVLSELILQLSKILFSSSAMGCIYRL